MKSMTAEQRNHMLLCDPVSSVIPKMAVPTIISMLITNIYNMADTFFVSQIGTSASGAVGVIFSAMAIIQAVSFMIGMGAGTHVSQALGAGNKKKADTYASTAFFTAFIAGIILAFFSLTHIDFIVRFLGSTETIAPYAKDYATYIFYAMPFAMWLFLGIEQLPLAAEEVREPEKNIPKSSRLCIFTLGLSALIIVFLNPAVVGSEALAGSDEPLLDGYRAILPGNLAAVLSAFALIGLLASIQGIMFAYGRNLYSLSRAGYYPAFLSLTGKKKTPYWGLVVGAIIGFAALFIIAYGGDGAGSVVLNIAVWGAVLAYLLQMVSYVILRKKMPDIKRPFTSPFGMPGAVIAGLLAFCIFVAVLLNPDYRLAVYAMVVIYVLATIFFAVYGRKHLVLSPEEEFAASGGKVAYKTED